MRVAQMVPQVQQEIIYNKLVGQHKGKLKEATQGADREIKDVIKSLKGQQPAEEDLLKIYQVIEKYAHNLDFVKAELEREQAELARQTEQPSKPQPIQGAKINSTPIAKAA